MVIAMQLIDVNKNQLNTELALNNAGYYLTKKPVLVKVLLFNPPLFYHKFIAYRSGVKLHFIHRSGKRLPTITIDRSIIAGEPQLIRYLQPYRKVLESGRGVQVSSENFVRLIERLLFGKTAVAVCRYGTGEYSQYKNIKLYKPHIERKPEYYLLILNNKDNAEVTAEEEYTNMEFLSYHIVIAKKIKIKTDTYTVEIPFSHK